MVSLQKFSHGLEYLKVTNAFAKAKLTLQGAHIFEYTPKNKKSILWLSEASSFVKGVSIRGGIPICWPWFGMHKSDKRLPQHGFARTALWTHTHTKEFKEFTQITLELTSSPQTKEMFDFDFKLCLIVEIGNVLRLKLTTKNTDTSAFKITQALHSYINVSDINKIEITGLENKNYFDALDSKHKTQAKSIKISKEVDRVFQDTEDEIQLKDTQNTISITREGSNSVVVWNPWIDKCARMSAMKDDSYKTFVCIESANAMEDEIEILSQSSHTLQTTITYLS